MNEQHAENQEKLRGVAVDEFRKIGNELADLGAGPSIIAEAALRISVWIILTDRGVQPLSPVAIANPGLQNKVLEVMLLAGMNYVDTLLEQTS